jgi:putative ABC transport system ATP-binding protein
VSTDEPLISLRGATRVYRMGEVDVTALAHADLDILQGDFLVVVGPSGSGKSTLLNLIGGMDRPTSGDVLYRGRSLADASDGELTRYRRSEVGFIFQFYNLVPSLTAAENVQVAAELVREPMDVLEALDMVGLADRSGHFPAQLSGGEQQRVSVARALVTRPQMLLCDEPTGALDLEMSRHVLGLLDRLNRELGKTVVLITHNMAIAGLARRIVHLHDGRVGEVTENANPVPVEQIQW